MILIRYGTRRCRWGGCLLQLAGIVSVWITENSALMSRWRRPLTHASDCSMQSAVTSRRLGFEAQEGYRSSMTRMALMYENWQWRRMRFSSARVA